MQCLEGARPRRDRDQRQYDRRLEHRAREDAAGSLAIVWQSIALFNLWLAGVIVEASGRALRPWPSSTPSSCRTPFPPSPRACSPPSCRGSYPSPPASPARCSLPMCSRALPCCMPSAVACRFAGCCSPPSISVFCLGWVAIAIAILGLAEPMLRLRDRAATHGQPPNPD